MRQKIKSNDERLTTLEKENQTLQQEIEKLLEILYGVDSAKKFDEQDWAMRNLKPMATTAGWGLGMSKYHSVPKFKYPNHHIEETEDIWQTSNDVKPKAEIDQ